jgi:hypothetical protein
MAARFPGFGNHLRATPVTADDPGGTLDAPWGAFTPRNGGSIMLSKLMLRSGLVAIAAAAMLGLAGCSLLSNGYGGWYWQSPSETQATANQNNTGNYNSTANSQTPNHG